MQKIAVLTSGGDAPGMNAAVRAVVRACAAHAGIAAVGVRRGYEGLMAGDFVTLGARDVANVLQRGGTMLRTARSKAFMTTEGRAQAAQQCRRRDLSRLDRQGDAQQVWQCVSKSAQSMLSLNNASICG